MQYSYHQPKITFKIHRTIEMGKVSTQRSHLSSSKVAPSILKVHRLAIRAAASKRELPTKFLSPKVVYTVNTPSLVSLNSRRRHSRHRIQARRQCLRIQRQNHIAINKRSHSIMITNNLRVRMPVIFKVNHPKRHRCRNRPPMKLM